MKSFLYLLILSVFLSFGFTNDKHNDPKPVYEKIYSGVDLVAEGWSVDGFKDKYWKFYKNGVLVKEGHYDRGVQVKYWKYYLSGKILREGHFCDGQKCQWWVEYDLEGNKSSTTEYVQGKRNGLSLIYESGELVKAVKYEDGSKVGEWTDYAAFVRDN